MWNSTNEREPLDILAEEFAQQCRSGKNPSVSDYANRFPDLADDITELFPSVALLEQLRTTERSERSIIARQQATLSVRHDLIEGYDILREVGRGGMGVVYEAIQTTLQRRVALKVLNDHAIESGKQVQRFAREARSAAALHHTNIVPVFGFKVTDEVHYYAMQFIDGAALDEIISVLSEMNVVDNDEFEITSLDRLSVDRTATAIIAAQALQAGEFAEPRKPGAKLNNLSRQDDTQNVAAPVTKELSSPGFESTVEQSQSEWDTLSRETQQSVSTPPSSHHQAHRFDGLYWKSIARIGAQVADALQYAHGHRVLHRDIKPSNLLLDEQGTVWITDFGLVKRLEDDGLTKSGDVVGTLRYMAPEQLNGKADARSDVYSLGLSLYEMLTLSPAFPETGHATLIENKTKRVLSSPRATNRAIPRDLETIVMKACALDPTHRYQQAGNLADDLQRFLEERPITARRVSSLEAFWRWGLRNRALAISSAAAALLLIAVAIVAQLGKIRTEAALARVEVAKTRTEAALARVDLAKNRTEAALNRAEANVDVAVDAFEEIFDNIASRDDRTFFGLEIDGDESPPLDSVLTQADAKLLRSLLEFYEKFAAQNASDARLRLSQLNAYRRMGQIYHRLGQFKESSKSFVRAIDIAKSLREENPNQINIAVAQARSLNDFGLMLSTNSDEFQLTIRVHVGAITLLKEQPPEIAQAHTIRFELARSYDLLGSIGIRNGLSELPTDNNRFSSTASLHTITAPTNETSDQPNDASQNRQQFDVNKRIREILTEACQILERLIVEEEENPKYRLAFARAQRHRLLHALKIRESDEAGKAFRAAVETLEHLAEDFPDDPKFKFELAETLAGATSRLPEIESAEDAEQLLNQALLHATTLIDQFPTNPKYPFLQASTYSKLGLLKHEQGELPVAKRYFEDAFQVMAALSAIQRNDARFETQFALTQHDFATVVRDIGKINSNEILLRQSRQLLLEATERFERFAKQRRDAPFFHRITSRLYLGLAETLTELGEMDAAMEAVEKARIASKNPWIRIRRRPVTPQPKLQEN